VTFSVSSSTTPALPRFSRAKRSRKSDLVSAFLHSLRTPHVPGVSWRPHPAGVATRRPGRVSDGRDGPERRPSRRNPTTSARPWNQSSSCSPPRDHESPPRSDLSAYTGRVGAWRSLVARRLWVAEVPGSNPGAPTEVPVLLGVFADDWAAVLLLHSLFAAGALLLRFALPALLECFAQPPGTRLPCFGRFFLFFLTFLRGGSGGRFFFVVLVRSGSCGFFFLPLPEGRGGLFGTLTFHDFPRGDGLDRKRGARVDREAQFHAGRGRWVGATFASWDCRESQAVRAFVLGGRLRRA
jgi:hypothetical protein